MSTEETASNENKQEGWSKESIKVKNNYDRAWKGVIALFKGEGNVKPVKKVPADDIAALIDEVAADEVKAKKEEFKTKAQAIIKSRASYDKFLEDKEREFQKAKDAKTKEFTGELNALLQLVTDIESIKASYAQTLGGN